MWTGFILFKKWKINSFEKFDTLLFFFHLNMNILQRHVLHINNLCSRSYLKPSWPTTAPSPLLRHQLHFSAELTTVNINNKEGTWWFLHTPILIPNWILLLFLLPLTIPWGLVPWGRVPRFFLFWLVRRARGLWWCFRRRRTSRTTRWLQLL